MERDDYEDRRDRSRSPPSRRSASPTRRDEDERMPDRDRREPRYFTPLSHVKIQLNKI